MATVQQQQQRRQQMPAATLDKDYDYYGGKGAPNGTRSSSNMPRVKKGLGAMPMQPVEDHHATAADVAQPRAVSPQHGMDPPGISEEGQQPVAPSEGDEALLDLEQLEELHHEAERMKALGNKHMAAQVSK
jgi:hypothetical protein